MGIWKFYTVQLIWWLRTFIPSLCKAKSSASSGILFWGLEKPVSMWKHSSVAKGGQKYIRILAMGWKSGSSWIVSPRTLHRFLRFLVILKISARPRDRWCCGVVREAYCRVRSFESWWSWSCVVLLLTNVLKRIGRGPEINSFATYIKRSTIRKTGVCWKSDNS